MEQAYSKKKQKKNKFEKEREHYNTCLSLGIIDETQSDAENIKQLIDESCASMKRMDESTQEIETIYEKISDIFDSGNYSSDIKLSKSAFIKILDMRLLVEDGKTQEVEDMLEKMETKINENFYILMTQRATVMPQEDSEEKSSSGFKAYVSDTVDDISSLDRSVIDCPELNELINEAIKPRRIIHSSKDLLNTHANAIVYLIKDKKAKREYIRAIQLEYNRRTEYVDSTMIEKIAEKVRETKVLLEKFNLDASELNNIKPFYE